MSQGIGILGFQGDVSEHIGIIKTIARKHKKNIPVTEIRKKDQLDNVSGLIIPGGESTTMYKLLNLYGIYDEVISKTMNGFPVMGTCAGLIVISRETNDSRVKGMNLIDTTIERNAYGRQIDSFIHEINISGIGEYKAVFIRAPVISDAGSSEILAVYNNKPVMVRKGNILGMTFHPELTNDLRVHEYFLDIVGGEG